MKKINKNQFVALLVAAVMVISSSGFMPVIALANGTDGAVTSEFPASNAFIIDSGLTGTVGGDNRAPWVLYSDGTLVVNNGFIHWEFPWVSESCSCCGLNDWGHSAHISPWDSHRNNISRIIFDGPIVAGTYLQGLFMGLSNITTIYGLSNIDISNVRTMQFMFFGARSLTRLDLSSFDTHGVTGVNGMHGIFTNTTSLQEIILGENFVFTSSWIGLPDVPSDNQFAGSWQNVGSGTADNPQGEHILTSAQLAATFNGNAMADTWVWLPRHRAYSMPTLTVGTAAGRRGDTVSVPVSLQNNPGIAGFRITFTYDHRLTPVDLDDTAIRNSFGGSVFVSSINMGARTITIVWAATYDISTENLFSLNFTINDHVHIGYNEIITVPVTVSIEEMKYVNHSDVRSVTQNGFVSISNIIDDVIFGDVNQDGIVNVHDLIRLAQHLTDTPGMVGLRLTGRGLFAADVFYDGSVNISDAIHLAQYLASEDPNNPDVILGPGSR